MSQPLLLPPFDAQEKAALLRAPSVLRPQSVVIKLMYIAHHPHLDLFPVGFTLTILVKLPSGWIFFEEEQQQMLISYRKRNSCPWTIFQE